MFALGYLIKIGRIKMVLWLDLRPEPEVTTRDKHEGFEVKGNT